MPLKGVRVDLTGKRFGKLTVIGLHKKTKTGLSIWSCICDCGNHTKVRHQHLQSGETKSCGCLTKECRAKLEGKRFGRLTVLEYHHSDKRWTAFFKCKCDCGKEIVTSGAHLTSGHTKSCGCKKPGRKYNFSAYKKRLVQSGYEVRFINNDKSKMQVTCHYCNMFFYPTKKQIKNRMLVIAGRKTGASHLYCSGSCKKSCPTFNMSTHPKDLKNKNPGSSREVQPQLRKMVLERDNWQCQICGKSKEQNKTLTLHCHHILPVKSNPIESADIDNCITLCKACHKKVHSQKGCRYSDLRDCVIE